MTEEEVDKIIQMNRAENIDILMEMREDVFNDTASNIRRAQKRQKKTMI